MVSTSISKSLGVGQIEGKKFMNITEIIKKLRGTSKELTGERMEQIKGGGNRNNHVRGSSQQPKDRETNPLSSKNRATSWTELRAPENSEREVSTTHLNATNFEAHGQRRNSNAQEPRTMQLLEDTIGYQSKMHKSTQQKLVDSERELTKMRRRMEEMDSQLEA